MGQWYDERHDEWVPYDTPDLSFEISGDPEIMGMLYGPDGDPMVVLWDRDTVPFGFQRRGDDYGEDCD